MYRMTLISVLEVLNAQFFIHIAPHGTESFHCSTPSKKCKQSVSSSPKVVPMLTSTWFLRSPNFLRHFPLPPLWWDTIAAGLSFPWPVCLGTHRPRANFAFFFTTIGNRNGSFRQVANNALPATAAGHSWYAQCNLANSS
jgi:hypothetical protein